jgi:ATP-dependent DNA helicase 2 subunit 1
MADIFSFLGEAAAPRSSLSGTSIEDLENHLRGLLGTKVAPGKAEHISFTYELSSATKFTIAVSHFENDVLEGLGGIDPALGGARSTAHDDPAQLSRIILANDTIMNQSQNEPSLQKVVAKHIIGAVGACDASSWVLREMSRGNQGWAFTYICKDSMTSWRRQHRDLESAVIGDYSAKEADPLTTGALCVPYLTFPP